jgi:hypothetical protein|nr:MAG TPA: Septum formation initiator [Caudoviricetes sp.]
MESLLQIIFFIVSSIFPLLVLVVFAGLPLYRQIKRFFNLQKTIHKQRKLIEFIKSRLDDLLHSDRPLSPRAKEYLGYLLFYIVTEMNGIDEWN